VSDPMSALGGETDIAAKLVTHSGHQPFRDYQNFMLILVTVRKLYTG
jgi:hypothetical protein